MLLQAISSNGAVVNISKCITFQDVLLMTSLMVHWNTANALVTPMGSLQNDRLCRSLQDAFSFCLMHYRSQQVLGEVPYRDRYGSKSSSSTKLHIVTFLLHKKLSLWLGNSWWPWYGPPKFQHFHSSFFVDAATAGSSLLEVRRLGLRVAVLHGRGEGNRKVSSGGCSKTWHFAS